MVAFLHDGHELSVSTVDIASTVLVDRTSQFRSLLDDQALGAENRVYQLGQRVAEQLDWLAQKLTPALVSQLSSPASHNDDHVPHLIIVPGPLQHWPLAALPLGQGLLMDQYACTILPTSDTLTTLARAAERMANRGGNRKYHGFAPPSDPPLKYSLAQAYSGRISFDGPVDVGPKATFERIADANAAVIVISSHAAVHPEHPDLATLQIGMADGRDDSLTALEILYGLPNLNAALIVLLACNVHGAPVGAGDAWQGLTRAFLRAGRSIITSMWPIFEDSTTRNACPLLAGDPKWADGATSSARRRSVDSG